MINLEQRYKKVSANLAAFGGVQVKKKKYIKSPLQYKNLKGSFLDTKKYPQTIQSKLKELSVYKPKERIVEKPVYLGEPGRKGDKGEKGDKPIAGKDYKVPETPVKGIHYFTTEEVESIKKEITTELESKIPEVPEQIKVDEELVKRIVQLMHTLPEADKLEVSKGIRNAQSFIYGGTKYKTSELMHGAGSGGAGNTFVYNEILGGSGTAFTFATAPIAGLYTIYARGQKLIPTTDYTVSGVNVTTVDTFIAGDLMADSQHI